MARNQRNDLRDSGRSGGQFTAGHPGGEAASDLSVESGVISRSPPTFPPFLPLGLIPSFWCADEPRETETVTNRSRTKAEAERRPLAHCACSSFGDRRGTLFRLAVFEGQGSDRRHWCQNGLEGFRCTD